MVNEFSDALRSGSIHWRLKRQDIHQVYLFLPTKTGLFWSYSDVVQKVQDWPHFSYGCDICAEKVIKCWHRKSSACWPFLSRLGKSSVKQMIMGAGKTSVVSPLHLGFTLSWKMARRRYLETRKEMLEHLRKTCYFLGIFFGGKAFQRKQSTHFQCQTKQNAAIAKPPRLALMHANGSRIVCLVVPPALISLSRSVLQNCFSTVVQKRVSTSGFLTCFEGGSSYFFF